MASFVGLALLAVGSYLSVKSDSKVRGGEMAGEGMRHGIIGLHWHFTFGPTAVAEEQEIQQQDGV